MTYFLLILSGMLFALQFCVDKYYRAYKPENESSSVLYAMLGKTAAVAVFFVCILCSGSALFGNLYTLLVGLVQAVLNLLIMVFGLRVLSVGSVAMYTVAMMIGGMAVPAVFGALFLGDDFGVLRIVAFVLITAAVALSASGERKKPTVKALLLYGLLFLCNGFIGVFTALHTNIWGTGISDFTFMLITCTEAAVCYLPVWGFTAMRERGKDVPTVQFPHARAKALYRLSPYAGGMLNGVANLLIVMGTATGGIGSVVTFPLVTGGTILFTTLFAWAFYKERPSLFKWLGVALIIGALVVFIL